MDLPVEFWSSVELGAFNRGLLRELRHAGVDASPRFEVSESAYRFAHGFLERARLRWRSYVSYPLHLHHDLRGRRSPSIAVICTNTFYAPAVAVRVARRRGLRVVNWVLDLFPDVLVESGTIASGGLVHRQLSRLTRTTFTSADANVFLSDRLKAHAIARYGEIPRATVIPVGADGQPFRAVVPFPRPSGSPARILYCGNLGRMHEVDTLAKVLRTPLQGLIVEFRGNGAGYRSLERLAGHNDSVQFGPGLPDDEWARALQGADIALVTLKPGAEGLVMPSKTYSAMVAGQAILAVCPRASDLADTVLANDAGWVIEPGDVAGLRDLLARLSQQPAEILEKRRNAFTAGHQRYDQRTLSRAWIDVLLASIARTQWRG